MEKDGIAAYYLMLRWVATSDLEWATAAETVLDAWSASLIGFAGHDQMLGTVAVVVAVAVAARWPGRRSRWRPRCWRCWRWRHGGRGGGRGDGRGVGSGDAVAGVAVAVTAVVLAVAVAVAVRWPGRRSR